MNFKTRHFIHFTALSLCALWVVGCSPDDALLDDAVHHPAQASENYPITLVKGPQTLEMLQAMALCSQRKLMLLQALCTGLCRLALHP